MNRPDNLDLVPDVQIWKLLKSGDRAALKQLFERHYHDLYLYAYRLSGDRFLAKDCVQELFFRIWDRRRHLADSSNVKAYLWISLRRDVFKAIDREFHTVSTEDIITYSSSISFTKEDLIIRREQNQEQTEALVNALNALPDRHREAIFLKYFNGMGYKEIQQIMSINYQTARNYVSKGVKALKKQLEGRTFISSWEAIM
ncbi:RNA polymerase sigma factor [Halalkalibaculum sp. DA384]|uniref:RNA polymerase sigma factor n=1 Tax=Halalkalibaculum sp. DA384 TaxID=3373606 RepID=UPI0037547E4F